MASLEAAHNFHDYISQNVVQLMLAVLCPSIFISEYLLKRWFTFLAPPPLNRDMLPGLYPLAQ